MTLPYERGALLPDTAADVAKLRAAWRIVALPARDGTLYDFTGLERSLELGDVQPGMLDDDLAPALVGDRLTGSRWSTWAASRAATTSSWRTA